MKVVYNACLFAAICAAFVANAASTVESQTFESGADANWEGPEAEVATLGTAITVPACGLPISARTPGTKVLAVEGSATRTYNAGADTTMVDMMIQISIPSAALTELTGDDAASKFGLAVDNDGKLKAFCIPKGGSVAAWTDVGAGVFADDSWIRVSIKFDYANGRCLLAVNGDPCISSYGYLTATDTTNTGAWYALANTASNLASVEARGSFNLDEVLVTTGADSKIAYNGDGATAAQNAFAQWKADYGISQSATTLPDGSGMTPYAKWNVGYTPFDGVTFAGQFVQNSSTANATLSFNGYAPKEGSYRLYTKIGNGEWTQGDTVAATGTGVNSVDVGLPSDEQKVILYKIVVE